MIRRITNVKQVLDLLEKDNIKFYGGKGNELTRIKNEDLGKMDLPEVKKYIESGLWMAK